MDAPCSGVSRGVFRVLEHPPKAKPEGMQSYIMPKPVPYLLLTDSHVD